VFREDIKNHLAESYKGIYSMHKYWSKKPFNVIKNFIVEYTQQGDIVLDPFCGSGVAISESVFNNRKAIGVDINPMAIFITKEMLVNLNIPKFKEEFENLKNTCKPKIDAYYLVKRENKEFTATHFIWDKGKMVELWYYNENGNKVIEEPIKSDFELADSFNIEKIEYFFPETKFYHNSRINADRTKHVYDLFTPRNLKALSFLLKTIDEVRDGEIKNALKFCFTASLGQASKMVFVVKNRGKFNKDIEITERKDVGSWVIGYWVPKENMEVNAWNCFENKYRKIVKAKEQQKNLKYSINFAENIDDFLTKNGDVFLVCNSAVKMLETIPNDSIDYVITDPPHGNRLPFLEQSMKWNEWLKEKVDYDGEIVISDSPDKNKGIEDYYNLLTIVLQNIERVLKPQRYFSLMFNSIDDDTWLKLVKLLNNLKFDLVKIETLSYSANSVVQDNRMGGLKTDFIFTFIKNPEKIVMPIEFFSVNDNKNYFIDLINGFLSAEDGLELYEILNKLIKTLLTRGKFFKLSDVLLLIRKDYKNVGKKMGIG
jgi:DNA modification methylase